MCRGMPSCPWDICGGGPGRGLVGFLWGTPEVFGGSCSRAFRDLGLRLPGADSRLGPRGWPAVDCPGSRSRLICQGEGDPPASRRGGAQGQCWRGHCRCCQVSVMMRS